MTDFKWEVGMKYKTRDGGFAEVIAVKPDAPPYRQLVVVVCDQVHLCYITGMYSTRPGDNDILPELYEEPTPKVSFEHGQWIPNG